MTKPQHKLRTSLRRWLSAVALLFGVLVSTQAQTRDVITFAGGNVDPNDENIYVIDVSEDDLVMITDDNDFNVPMTHVTFRRPKGAAATQPASITLKEQNSMDSEEITVNFAPGETEKQVEIAIYNFIFNPTWSGNLPGVFSVIRTTFAESEYQVLLVRVNRKATVQPELCTYATQLEALQNSVTDLSVSSIKHWGQYVLFFYQFTTDVKIEPDSRCVIQANYVDPNGIMKSREVELKPLNGGSICSQAWFLYRPSEDEVDPSYTQLSIDYPLLEAGPFEVANPAEGAIKYLFFSRSDLENARPFYLYSSGLEPQFSDVSINKTTFNSGETMVITAKMDGWKVVDQSWEDDVMSGFGVTLDGGKTTERRQVSFDRATGLVTYSVTAPTVSETSTIDVVFGPKADVKEWVEYDDEDDGYYEDVTKIVASKGGSFSVTVSPEEAPVVHATSIAFEGMPEDGSLIDIGRGLYSYPRFPVSISCQPANATDARDVTYEVINQGEAETEVLDYGGGDRRVDIGEGSGIITLKATLESGVSCSRTYYLVSTPPEGLPVANTFLAGTTFPKFQFEIKNGMGQATGDLVTVDYAHINGTQWTETYKYSELKSYQKEDGVTAFDLPFSFTEEHPEPTYDQIGQDVITARVSMEMPIGNGQNVAVSATSTLVPEFRKPSFDDYRTTDIYYTDSRPATFTTKVMYLPRKGFTVGYLFPDINVQETYNNLSGDPVPEWLTLEEDGDYYYTAIINAQLDLHGEDANTYLYTLAQRSYNPDEAMERHLTRWCQFRYATAENHITYRVNDEDVDGDLSFDNRQGVESFINKVKNAQDGILWSDHISWNDKNTIDYVYATSLHRFGEQQPDGSLTIDYGKNIYVSDIYDEVLDLLNQTKAKFEIYDNLFDGAEVTLKREDDVIQNFKTNQVTWFFIPPSDGHTYTVEVYYPAYDKRYTTTFVSGQFSNVYAIHTRLEDLTYVYHLYKGDAELLFTDGLTDRRIPFWGGNTMNKSYCKIKGFVYAEAPRNFYLQDIPPYPSIKSSKLRVNFDNGLMPLNFNPPMEMKARYDHKLFDFDKQLFSKFHGEIAYSDNTLLWTRLTSNNTLVTVVNGQGEPVNNATLHFACVDKDLAIGGEAGSTEFDDVLNAYQISTDPGQHAQLIEVVADGYQPVLSTMYLWNYDYYGWQNRGKMRRHTIVLQQQEETLHSLDLETMKRDGNLVDNEMVAAINADNLLMKDKGETLNFTQTADYATATKHMKDPKFGTEGWSGTKYVHLTGMMPYTSTPELTLTTADGSMLLQPTMKYINKTDFTTFAQNYCQFDFDLTDQIADNATVQPVLKNGTTTLAELPSLHNHTIDLMALNEANNISLPFDSPDLAKVDDNAAANGVDMKDMNKAFDKFNFQLPPVLPFTVSIERDGDYFSVRAVCEVNFLPGGPITSALDKLDNLNYFDEQFQACMDAVNTAKPADDNFFDDIPRWPSAFCGIKGYLSGIGYVNPETGKLDINFLDGGLTFEASARASANVSFFLGGFGMSVDAKIAMSMGLINTAAEMGNVSASSTKIDFVFDYQTRLKVCAWAYGGIDLWIAKATAGVRGGACIDLHHRAYVSKGQTGMKTTLQAKMEAYAEARFLFWTARKSWPILDAYKEYLTPNSPSNPFHPNNEEPIFSMSRQNVTRSYKKLKRKVIADLGTPIINKVNGMAQPTYMLGGESLLFNNLKTPGDYNDDCVQIYNNGSKSDLVDTGIYAPMYDFAEAHNSDGLEVVAFEQVKQTIDASELESMSENDQTKTVSEKCEIHVAMRQNGGAWSTETVGSYWGNIGCVNPAVAVQSDGKAVVVWQQGVAKFNEQGSRYIDGSLMLSCYDGSSWGEPTEIKRLNRRSVPTDYQVSMNYDEILVMMTLQQDVENEEKPASVVYVSVVPMKDKLDNLTYKVREHYTQVEGSKPQMVSVNGTNLVGFLKTTDEGRDIELSTVNMRGEPTAGLTGLLGMKNRMVNDFRLIVDDEASDLSDVALLWSQGDQESTDNGNGTQTVNIKNRIYASKLCSHDHQLYFSTPVVIATMPDDVSLVSMDGSLNALDMKVAYCVANEQDGGAVLETPVAFTNAIDHRVSFNAYEVTSEQQVPITVTVANNGFEPIESIDITMGDKTFRRDVTLMPQETIDLKVDYPVDDDFDGTIAYDVIANFTPANSNALMARRRAVAARPHRIQQSGTQMDVRQVDLALKMLSKRTDAKGVTTIVAEVNNASLLPLADDLTVKVGLYDGTLSADAVGQEVTVTAADLYDATAKQNKVKIVTLTAAQPDFAQMLYLRTTPMDGSTVLTDVRPSNNVLPVSLAGKYLLGDANNDGKVSIADVTAIINHINGNTSGTFNEKAANVNRDDTISIADVTGVINIINK